MAKAKWKWSQMITNFSHTYLYQYYKESQECPQIVFFKKYTNFNYVLSLKHKLSYLFWKISWVITISAIISGFWNLRVRNVHQVFFKGNLSRFRTRLENGGIDHFHFQWGPSREFLVRLEKRFENKRIRHYLVNFLM